MVLRTGHRASVPRVGGDGPKKTYIGNYQYYMKKLTPPWSPLTIMLMAGSLIFSVCTTVAIEQTESDLLQEGFSDDPALYNTPVVPRTQATSPLEIKSKGDQTNLRVETNTPISPYLGAVKKPMDVPEDMSLRLGNRSDNLLDNYHLETGVGLKVNKNTEINLGYRFKDSPSLQDDPSSEASRQESGDLRFSLEIKLPF